MIFFFGSKSNFNLPMTVSFNFLCLLLFCFASQIDVIYMHKIYINCMQRLQTNYQQCPFIDRTSNTSKFIPFSLIILLTNVFFFNFILSDQKCAQNNNNIFF